MSIKTIGAAVVGAVAIGLGSVVAAPVEAATLTQTFSSTSSFGTNLFQQFDASLGTLQSVVLAYSSSSTQDYVCSSSCRSSTVSSLNFVFPGTSELNFSATNGPTTFSAGPVSQTATTFGTYTFASLVPFIGTGKIGSYNKSGSFGSVNGSLSSFPSLTRSNNFSLTYTYDAAPIPTPALLPGLIGMGVAAWRKRKGEQSEQVVETAEV